MGSRDTRPYGFSFFVVGDRIADGAWFNCFLRHAAGPVIFVSSRL